MVGNKALSVFVVTFLILFGAMVVLDFSMRYLIGNSVNGLSFSPDEVSSGESTKICQCVIDLGTIITPTENPYIKYVAADGLGCALEVEICAEANCKIRWVLMRPEYPSSWDYLFNRKDYDAKWEAYLFWFQSKEYGNDEYYKSYVCQGD